MYRLAIYYACVSPVVSACSGFDRFSGRIPLYEMVSIYRLRIRGRTSRHTFRFQFDVFLLGNHFRYPLRLRSSRLDLCRLYTVS